MATAACLDALNDILGGATSGACGAEAMQMCLPKGTVPLYPFPDESGTLENIIDALNHTDLAAEHEAAAQMLKQRIHAMWARFQHDSCSEDGVVNQKDAKGAKFILDNLKTWPISVADEEHKACVCIKWPAYLLPLTQSTFISTVNDLGFLWLGMATLPPDGSFTKACLTRFNELIQQLATFLSDLTSLWRGTSAREWALKLGHIVYWHLRELINGEHKNEVFEKDGRLGYVKDCLETIWEGIVEWVEKKGVWELWEEKPEYED